MFKKFLLGLSVMTSVAWCMTAMSWAAAPSCTPASPAGVCTQAKRDALLCAQTANGIVFEICTDAVGQAPILDLHNELTTFQAIITVPPGPPVTGPSFSRVNWSIDGNCGFNGNDITAHVDGIGVSEIVNPPGVGGTTQWLKGEYTREAVVIPLVVAPASTARTYIVDMVFSPPLGGGPKKPVKAGRSSIALPMLSVSASLQFLDGPVLGPVCGGAPSSIKTVAQSYRRTDSQGNQFQIDVTFDESGQPARVIKTDPNGAQHDITGLGLPLGQAFLDVGDGKGLQPIKDLPDGTPILSGLDSSCTLFLGGRYYVFC